MLLLPSRPKFGRNGHDDGAAVRWYDRAFSPTPPVTDRRLIEAEARLGIRLPEDYLDVVRTYQGCAPDRWVVTLPDGTRTALSMLLHFEDQPEQFNLVRIVQDSAARYGKLIPFAVDPDCNYFCFDYRGESDHSWSGTRWNRPVVFVPTADPNAEPQFLAAGFTELIDSLQDEFVTSR